MQNLRHPQKFENGIVGFEKKAIAFRGVRYTKVRRVAKTAV